METLFGGLFEFDSKESLDHFIENLDKNSALKLVELCLNYIQNNGLFTFSESHIIYLCLNKLKENENTILSDNNPDGNSPN